ncbi:MAG TPA: RNA polymerase sigma factor [Oceanipulchritudo sp.]|nr:RNA polymerase sigma factor [Oceanipulchritudo sp.]
MPDSNDNSFETLVAAYYQPLYRFGYSLSKSPDDAADLVQQTFLIWADKGHTLRDPSKVKSWLFTSLYREFLRHNRRGRTVTAIDQEILETHQDSSLVSSPRQLEGNEAIEALHEMDAVYREPLILFYLEDLTYKEIADVLDIPIGTVMSRLARGKGQLKTTLSEKFLK